ncbi:MAG: tRNA threonylcarbamoyladenosine biosynthesis protein TsaB [Solirubrobacteraceae bacterium]|nr:tRNA threonylcarbamoyladenosine biosynthesis protein TsaB [Solirubrobacteraceae bacterium]
MIVLALDTATSATVVGLRAAGGTIREARDDVEPGTRPRHTQRLLPLAAGLLAEAGLRFEDLDLIAVGIGPGTFTGLRIGIATARGLAQATGAPVVGLCTLRVLATAADAAQTSTTHRPPTPVLALIDAGRGEAFVGGYERGREVVAPAPVGPDGLAAVAEGRGWLGVGSGALRFRGQLEDANVAVAPDESPLHRVSAVTMLGLALDDDVDARAPVTPLYLRLPDAELALRSTRP